MARKSGFTPQDVDQVYAQRKARTAEPSLDPGERVTLPTGDTRRIYNHHDPQFAADAPAPGYDNDASGWVRGAAGRDVTCDNEDATGKPGFDHSPSRSKMRR